MEIIKELSDMVSQIPQDIENAKKEAQSQVTAVMGAELLRLEEQYE